MKIKPSTVNISEVTTGMNIIKLETSERCLVGGAGDVKLGEKLIYIRDAILPVIFIFDQNGKFINKLHKEGRGYGEYLSINDFVVDEKEQTIEVLDISNKKICIYELSSLRFINDIAIPLSVVFKFEKKNGIYYFHTHGQRNVIDQKKTNSDIIAFDPATKKLIPLFDKILPDNANRSFDIAGFSSNQKDQLFFSKTWHDQFYIIDQMSAKPILAVNAGSRGVPKAIKDGSYEQQEEFLNSGMSKDIYLFFKLAFWDQDNTIIIFTNGTSPYDLHYYMRLAGKEYVTNKIKIDYIDSEPDLIMSNTFIVGSNIISVLIPNDDRSMEMSGYLKDIGVNDNDNIAIALFKIK